MNIKARCRGDIIYIDMFDIPYQERHQFDQWLISKDRPNIQGKSYWHIAFYADYLQFKKEQSNANQSNV